MKQLLPEAQKVFDAGNCSRFPLNHRAMVDYIKLRIDDRYAVMDALKFIWAQGAAAQQIFTEDQ